MRAQIVPRDNRAMSSKNSDDDLTRVLDGWVPGAGKGDPPIDPTRVLDGWKPGARSR